MKFIICLILVSLFVAQCHCHPGGANELLESIFGTVSNMQSSILENIKKMNDRIHDDIETETQQNKRLHKGIQNQASTGVYGQVSGTSSYSSSTSGSGISTSMVSGINSDGERFYTETTEEIKNGILCRTVKIRTPATGKLVVSRYSIDLSNPDAVLVPLKNKNHICFS